MKEITTRIFAAIICEVMLFIIVPIFIFMLIVGIFFMPFLCLFSSDLVVKDWFIFNWKKEK